MGNEKIRLHGKWKNTITWEISAQAETECESGEPLFFLYYRGSTHAFMNFQLGLKMFSDYMATFSARLRYCYTLRFFLELATNSHIEVNSQVAMRVLHVQQLANFVESCSKKYNPSNFSCNLQHGKNNKIASCYGVLHDTTFFCNLQHSVI